MISKFFVSLLFVSGLCTPLSLAWGQPSLATHSEKSNMTQQQALTQRQQAIVPIAAHAATGDLTVLKTALNLGLDTGLSVNDGKEILVQLYAYAGFPRSPNALGTLMTVLKERQRQGIEDAIGTTPSAPIPKGDELLAKGTATQTQLVGSPVQGPLFDFAPAADEYLKTHLFGDIFARDNLNWQDREVATIAMLSALPGAEPQLQAHIGMSLNTGLTKQQLDQIATVLAEQVGPEAAARTRTALVQHFER